jgi:hypothetical protein
MASRPLILWITDGVGWGFDIRSRAISKLLPEYKHMFPKTRVVMHSQIISLIRKYNPDIIMAMSPMILPCLHRYTDKIIATLPSHRSIDGTIQ